MFAVSDLVQPYPLSHVQVLSGVTVRPERDFIPDVSLTVTDEAGNPREYLGLPGTFGYLVAADISIMIPKAKIEVKEGDSALIGVSETDAWSTKNVQVYYPLLVVDVDAVREKELENAYVAMLVETRKDDASGEWPYIGPMGYLDPVPTSSNDYSYVFDVPKGDYLLIAYVSYYYRVASTNVDEGSGWYFFRIVVT